MQRRTLLKTLSLAAGAHLEGHSLRAFTEAGRQPMSEPCILVNQLGYLPQSPKEATIKTTLAQTDFRIRSAADHHAVFEGKLTPARLDTLSGDTVRQAVFSSLQSPGEYFLEAGEMRGDLFPIRANVYADALRTAVRGYTGQRCGCAVDLGNGYRHGACHLEGGYDPSSGKSGSLPNSGGWHDAGDYGRYVVNSGISCGTLLWAWEMFPAALRTLDLALPHKQVNTADFLDEVLWNLQWMLQLQDTDGGVFHKQTSTRFCAFTLPEDDHLVSEVIGTGTEPYKSTCATGDFAAVMAMAARCYAEFDPALALRFRTAAEKAWAWAMAHPDVSFDNPPGITTGSYADAHCSDEIAWASAELWRTTGEAQYEHAFLSFLPPNLQELRVGVPSWANVASLALWTYALAPPQGRSDVKAAIYRATATAAQALAANAESNGYGHTMSASDYGWGSNSEAGNQAFLLLVADRFHPDPAFRNAALSNLHYLLGRNYFGVSWVTGVGVRPFQHPHHRPSVADGITAPWPGLLSGGPNRHPADAVAKTLPPMPPMRMWIDNDQAYSMNEIAINWNAPLVLLLAFANSSSALISGNL